MDKKKIVVTGIGVLAPNGLGTSVFWDACCKGTSGIKPIRGFDASEFSVQIAGEIHDFDPLQHWNSKEVRKMDRFVQFAVAATTVAVEDASLDMNREDPARVGVLIGSGIGGLSTIEEQVRIYGESGPRRLSPFLIPKLIINMASGEVSIRLGARGPNFSVASACATGAHALGVARNIIREGKADVMIAGGSEAAITPVGFGGFCVMKALSTRNDDPQRASRPFDRERDGFVMAEGAGILILESLDHARSRGVEPYCELAGFGMNGDAHHITAPHPEGMGATACMQSALEDAGIAGDEVDYINAHGTSTPLNDKVETIAIKRLLGNHAGKVAVSSTKSVTGHLLGAAGGAESAVCALAIREGVVPPTINQQVSDPDCDLDYVPNEARELKVGVALNNSLGFGGHNATLIFQKLED